MAIRFTRSREWYLPKGAIKVADKQSDAVAYIYADPKGRPCARLFVGRQSKPMWAYQFRTPADRERSILRGFESCRAAAAEKRKRAAQRKAWVPTYKVGDVFRTSWGYDQTNVEFFEIVEIRGKMATLRELQQEVVETGDMRGKCVPLPGLYAEPYRQGDKRGQPIRRLMQEGRIKIDDVRTAWPVERVTVAGISVVKPSNWTSYA